MILVFASDVEPETLERISSDVADLGWKAEVSRSSEQVVMTLAGTGEPAALERVLSGLEVDVIPILSPREYRMRRSRRTLLTGLATGLGLVAAAGAGLPVVGFLTAPGGTLTDPDVVSAGSVRRLGAGSARTVPFHGQPVLVICLEPGQYVALSGTCTHMRTCTLEWDGERRILVCGCHGCLFDVHGNVLRGVASIPLASYLVERVGGELFVRRS